MAYTKEKAKAYYEAYREANPEKLKARRKAYYHANKEKQKAYYEVNKEKYKEWHKEYREANKEKEKLRKQAWFQANKAKAYRTSLKRKNKMNEFQTPAWANIDKMNETYKECKRISEETGILHHVDHIIPLNGRNVSGLHVETNLQIITAHENLSKHNSFAGDSI